MTHKIMDRGVSIRWLPAFFDRQVKLFIAARSTKLRYNPHFGQDSCERDEMFSFKDQNPSDSHRVGLLEVAQLRSCPIFWRLWP